MKERIQIALLAFGLAAAAVAAPISEISVDLRLDEIDYVSGERIRGVVDIKNMSPDSISVGRPASKDRLFVEVFRSSDMLQLERAREAPFVAPFRLDMNEGQKLEVFLADHYALREARRYMARPVLVHGSTRYEGQYRAFDVVPGIHVANALQMFSNKTGLSREFELVHWTRKGREHLFLSARDAGSGSRRWATTDVGAMMKLTKPTISILSGGEVVVLHRSGPDSFIRSEFWSLPDALEFRTRELVRDPETAGQSRVQEMYNKAGGVKAAPRPWWKFW
jgi:hypothetical protein